MAYPWLADLGEMVLRSATLARGVGADSAVAGCPTSVSVEANPRLVTFTHRRKEIRVRQEHHTGLAVDTDDPHRPGGR